jgi:Holliday junction resolvase RusA-like endonuclease
VTATPDTVVVNLPWPPSDNNYFKPFIVKGRPAIFTTGEGQRYQKQVRAIIAKAGVEMFFGRLRVAINAWPPDRKKDGSLNRNRRDIQNILKCLLDALEKSGAYKNDSQIDQLEICRQTPFGEGSVEVSIRELPGDPSLFDGSEDDDARPAETRDGEAPPF